MEDKPKTYDWGEGPRPLHALPRSMLAALIVVIPAGVLFLTGSPWLPVSSGIHETASYSFVKIADTSDGRFRRLGTTPSIDNAGRVLFEVELSDGTRGIYIGDGQTLTEVVTTAGSFSAFRGHPVMSKSGKIAFLAVLGDGHEVYIVGNPEIAELRFKKDRFDELGPIVINDRDMVAFKAKPVSKRDDRKRLFLHVEGVQKEVPQSSHSQLDIPSLNNNGAIAFSLGDEVWISDGSTSRKILDQRGDHILYSRPVINDSETVLVQAVASRKKGEVEKLLLRIQGERKDIIASTNGAFRDFFNHHAINNHGAIAFTARLDSGHEGLFTGGDPERDKVIVRGDLFLGRHMAAGGGPVLSSHGLNDQNQIAFFARLDDGTEGIFRADPVRDVNRDVNPGLQFFEPGTLVQTQHEP